MSIPNYTRQKLSEAVGALIGADTLQKRLASAGQYLIFVHEPAFPDDPEWDARFRRVKARLTQQEGPNGRLEVTTWWALTDEAANEIAKEILFLYEMTNLPS
jgi:hypothetical protein